MLQYDLCKTIPLEGNSSDNLKSISISNLLKEFLHNKWLCINRSSKNIRYERGPKYSNFVALYTSLYQYYKTNYLTNKEKLVHAKWIKTIEGRSEIIRGLKFPSVVDEKLVLFYKLLEQIYMQKWHVMSIIFIDIQNVKPLISKMQSTLPFPFFLKISKHNKKFCKIILILILISYIKHSTSTTKFKNIFKVFEIWAKTSVFTNKSNIFMYLFEKLCRKHRKILVLQKIDV